MAEPVCSQQPFTLRVTTDYKSKGDFEFSPRFPVHTPTQPQRIRNHRIPKIRNFFQQINVSLLVPHKKTTPTVATTDEGITDPPHKTKKPRAKRAATKKEPKKSTNGTLHHKFALKVEKLSEATLFELVEAIPNHEVDRIPWLFTKKELNARIALYEEILRLHDQADREGCKQEKMEDFLSEEEEEDEQAFRVEIIEDEEVISEEE
ncbi:hypothetical protein FN846DRAFT_894740 [Sphaerosporella brunnea]|uniref:Uncharacterized protein n=1 Tax=Sphaerosporella brunnea TaxID=1250544 RepID=A0A5J5EIP7_9PEZI|nr:hypothetical protein FN846DRAFT_894740 [Sphaerosporella brunnea]